MAGTDEGGRGAAPLEGPAEAKRALERGGEQEEGAEEQGAEVRRIVNRAAHHLDRGYFPPGHREFNEAAAERTARRGAEGGAATREGEGDDLNHPA